MHASDFLDAAGLVCDKLEAHKIEQLALALSKLKGRVFILGVGGSAANASHAVNDFRKLCGIEAYAPTDNVAELTARTNDEGWDTVFSGWLKVSHFNKADALLILSVGGGTEKSSPNVVKAILHAKDIGAKVFGIVGSYDGCTAKRADIALVVPIEDKKWITPLSEAFQAIIWHCLVSHPLLQKNRTKW